jgi:hypothetical protein
MPKRLNFRQRLDRYPPILIRLLATRGRGKAVHMPTDRQLAESCALTMAEFKFVAYSTAWAGPVMAYLDRYLAGCGVNLESRRCFHRLEWMRRHGHFSAWQKTPALQAQFNELIEIYEESENS